ncbi:MAG: ATP-binding protein, partial [Chloroflexota bacterium]
EIYHLKTGEAVGYVVVEFMDDFLLEESSGFLLDTLITSVIGGILTAVVALILGAWFAQRITAPVTALTEATNRLVRQEDPQLLTVKSNDELGQMSQSFNQMVTSLQTQRSLRKRLINDVSHELNTPLSVIQLEAKGLKDGLQGPDDAADQIIQEVDMLRNLVHDLNWLAETDSGEMRLTKEPVNLGSLLSAEVNRWQTQAQTQNISLQLQPVPNIPKIPLDQVRISQALGNLLKNALQHTEQNGSIQVSVTQTNQQNQKYVSVSIQDDGMGIDPADLPHLFERFYRTDQSRSRVSGGSGLGLAITQAIIEGHDGTISISSGGIDAGTTVRFELPIESG